MKESQLLEVFMYAGFFLALSGIVIPFLKKFKIPAVLGYLSAGIIFGPEALGSLTSDFSFLKYITLQDSKNIQLLSELGIVFLLFVIGLELTPQKLWRMRSLVFGLGLFQVLISSSFIGLIAFAWGNSWQSSILLGLGLSLSSTAIVTQYLHENKLFNSKSGKTSFSILLFQDLAVIPILLLITTFTANTGSDGLASYILGITAKMIAAIIAIVIVGKYILTPIFSFSNKHGSSEVFIALSLLVIVVSASIAGMAGLSLALGAFLGGLILAETHYSHEVSAIIIPFKSMLLGIFFMSFGMSIDLQFIAQKPFWLMASALGLIALKFIIIYALIRAWKLPNSTAVESSLMLPQAGEFGLLVVGSSITFGMLDNNVGQFMFLTIGITMILTPIMNPIASKLGIYLRKSEDQNIFKDEVVTCLKPEHVVIVGYGRMGQTISEILSRESIESIAFDYNVDTIKVGKANNSNVYFGDATKKSTLEAAKIENATCILVTIDQTHLIKVIYDNIREINAEVPIIIRARKLTDFESLNFKNTYLIPEYLSTSHLIAEKAFEYMGYSDEESKAIINLSLNKN